MENIEEKNTVPNAEPTMNFVAKKSNKTALISVAVIATVLIMAGVGFAVMQNTSSQNISQDINTFVDDEEKMMEKSSGAEAMKDKTDDVMMEKKDNMVEDTNTDEHVDTYKGKILAGTSSPLLVFNKEDYDHVVSENKLVVLYFYANWCPLCREEFPKMESVFDGLTTDQVVGFQVNYNDNETEEAEKALAREFGVAYQHTKVFLKDGKRVLKSPESWDESRYIEEINKFLK